MVWIETCDHHPYVGVGQPVKVRMQALVGTAGYFAGFVCPVCGSIRKVSGCYDTVSDLNHDWRGYVSNLTEVDLYSRRWVIYRPLEGLTECHPAMEVA